MKCNRKRSLKRMLGALLMLCMVMTLTLSTVTEVEAASKYKKKFSKTLNLGNGSDQKELVFTLKKKGTYTVTISSDVKSGDDYGTCTAYVWTGTVTKEVRCGEKQERISRYMETSEGYNKITLTIKSDGKGEQRITFSGWGDGYKVTVSAKTAVLKYKSLKKYVEPDGIG